MDYRKGMILGICLWAGNVAMMLGAAKLAEYTGIWPMAILIFVVFMTIGWLFYKGRGHQTDRRSS